MDRGFGNVRGKDLYRIRRESRLYRSEIKARIALIQKLDQGAKRASKRIRSRHEACKRLIMAENSGEIGILEDCRQNNRKKADKEEKQLEY